MPMPELTVRQSVKMHIACETHPDLNEALALLHEMLATYDRSAAHALADDVCKAVWKLADQVYVNDDMGVEV